MAHVARAVFFFFSLCQMWMFCLIGILYQLHRPVRKKHGPQITGPKIHRSLSLGPPKCGAFDLNTGKWVFSAIFRDIYLDLPFGVMNR